MGAEGFDLDRIKLEILTNAVRQSYVVLHEKGLTHARMADATGLPESTFSMWLSGYRDVVKVSVLDALIEGLRTLELEV